MEADFLDAHHRHLGDAETLFQKQRWANADHLYGMAVECGLKRLMMVFGMPYDAERDRPRQIEDRVHANGVWLRFESYRGGRVEGTDYTLSPNNPFANWDVSDRYANRSSFNEEHVQAHKSGAERVAILVRQAQLEGLLR